MSQSKIEESASGNIPITASTSIRRIQALVSKRLGPLKHKRLLRVKARSRRGPGRTYYNLGDPHLTWIPHPLRVSRGVNFTQWEVRLANQLLLLARQRPLKALGPRAPINQVLMGHTDTVAGYLGLVNAKRFFKRVRPLSIYKSTRNKLARMIKPAMRRDLVLAILVERIARDFAFMDDYESREAELRAKKAEEAQAAKSATVEENLLQAGAGREDRGSLRPWGEASQDRGRSRRWAEKKRELSHEGERRQYMNAKHEMRVCLEDFKNLTFYQDRLAKKDAIDRLRNLIYGSKDEPGGEPKNELKRERQAPRQPVDSAG